MKESQTTLERTSWLRVGGGIVLTLAGAELLIHAKTLANATAGGGALLFGIWLAGRK